jgi:hypothetical protein
MPKIKISPKFPEAFDRFEKFMRTNDLMVKNANSLLTYFQLWGSTNKRSTVYVPLTEKQRRNALYEAKIRGFGYADTMKYTTKTGKEQFRYQDKVSGRFMKRAVFEKQSQSKSIEEKS